MNKIFLKLIQLFITSIFLSITGFSHANTIPEALKDKVITLVVPYPPGGNSDLTARLVAKRTEELTGQKIIVVNRAGAGGSIGAKFVASSDPNGLTLCHCETQAAFVNRILGVEGSPAVEDLEPVSVISENSLVLAVPFNSPYTNFDSFSKGLKNKSVNFGSFGSMMSLWGLQLGNTIQTKETVLINFKGEAETILAMSQNLIDFAFISLNNGVTFSNNKQIRILAIGDSRKNNKYPEYALLKDFLDINVTNYQGIFGPKNIPEDVKVYLSRIFSEVTKDELFIKTMTDRGNLVVGGNIKNARDYQQSYYKQRLKLYNDYGKLLDKNK